MDVVEVRPAVAVLAVVSVGGDEALLTVGALHLTLGSVRLALLGVLAAELVRVARHVLKWSGFRALGE